MKSTKQPIKANYLRIAHLNLSQGKLGIDNIKTSFDIILDIVTLIVSLSKKFEFSLLLSFGFQIASHGNLIEIFKTALAEFKDLDAKEAKIVSSYVKQKFDIENDVLEQRIEEGIDLIEETYQAIPQIIKLGSSWYQYGRSWKKTA